MRRRKKSFLIRKLAFLTFENQKILDRNNSFIFLAAWKAVSWVDSFRFVRPKVAPTGQPLITRPVWQSILSVFRGTRRFFFDKCEFKKLMASIYSFFCWNSSDVFRRPDERSAVFVVDWWNVWKKGGWRQRPKESWRKSEMRDHAPDWLFWCRSKASCRFRCNCNSATRLKSAPPPNNLTRRRVFDLFFVTARRLSPNKNKKDVLFFERSDTCKNKKSLMFSCQKIIFLTLGR